jgi:site-specific DNA-methyltransferase (adenine-specific)
LFLEDMPYGTTDLEWDKTHPELSQYWEARQRVASHNAVYVLFCDEPFTSFLLLSNFNKFRQKLTWDKIVGGGFLNAHKMFLDRTEDVLVFSNVKNGNYTFNPIKTVKPKDKIRPLKDKIRPLKQGVEQKSSVYGRHKGKYNEKYNNKESYPTNVLEFHAFENECNRLNRVHPTQKPLDLFRYLIRTYSNESDLVFDGYSGSGTTAHACLVENRNFVGAELNSEYYQTAMQRIELERNQAKLF